MSYSMDELLDILQELRSHPETEVVEVKKAESNYSFKEIGQYFSALSNEANLRGKPEGWLVFGVADDMSISDTHYRDDEKALHSLKKEIKERTNQGLTFREIYTLTVEGKRVIMFQIPPALPGIPTTWNDMAYSRVDSSLAPLPLNKMMEIQRQIGYDWSKEIVSEASLSDLDPAAVEMAKELFIRHEVQRGKDPDYFAHQDTVSILNKAGILLGGRVTRTALILLGDEYAKNFFDGFIPRITWSLYNQDGSVKTYEHFDTPLLLAVDEVYKRIRNVKYRYIAGQQTLFPEEVDQYSPDLIKELLHNCIAHQDYTLRGKINVHEYEDRIVFLNEGHFIPGTIEKALEPGYKPPYYRNTFLCNAMVNLYMIDTNGIGIPTIFEIQQKKYFPLPTYDLSEPNRVRVTVYGKILDTNYTRLLNTDRDLDIQTVFLLDKIQKKETITLEDYQRLRKAGLAEGRYPNIYVSYRVAEAVGQPETYIRNSGLEDEKCKAFILKTLKTTGPAKKSQIMRVVEDLLPNALSPEKKSKKLTNLLQSMKNTDHSIDCAGKTNQAVWFIAEGNQDNHR